MKRLLILFFCCFVSVLAAEPIKVALTGDRNLVDLLTAELSNDKEIALLERSEIAKVLREYNLNASALTSETVARYFPHADVFAVVREQRLIVFNAKNGFLLWSRIIRERNSAARSINSRKNSLFILPSFPSGMWAFPGNQNRKSDTSSRD